MKYTERKAVKVLSFWIQSGKTVMHCGSKIILVLQDGTFLSPENGL